MVAMYACMYAAIVPQVSKIILNRELKLTNIKLKMALFFSFLVVRTTVLNSTILLITRNRLSVAQGNSSFKHLDMCTPTHATPKFIP